MFSGDCMEVVIGRRMLSVNNVKPFYSCMWLKTEIHRAVCSIMQLSFLIFAQLLIQADFIFFLVAKTIHELKNADYELSAWWRRKSFAD